MEPILYSYLMCILYPIVPLMAWKILRTAGIRPFHFSLPMFFIWNYLIFSYLGILPLYFEVIPYRAEVSGVNNQNIIFYMFLLSSLNLLLLSLGISLVQYIYPTTNKYRKIPIFWNYSSSKKPSLKMKFFLFFVTIVTIFMIYSYMNQVPNIALFAMLSDDSANLSLIRSNMTADFTGKLDLHWYRFFYSDMIGFLTFFSIPFFLYKKKFRRFLFFIFIFLIAITGSLLSGQKAPAALLLIGCFFSYLVSKGKVRLRMKTIIIFGIILIIVLTILYSLTRGQNNLLRHLYSVFSRVFTGQISPLYHYLRIFPDIEPYLMGKSFPNPKGIFPYEVYPLAKRVMEIVHPRVAERGITGSMPTVYWGEIYANFGPIIAGIVGLPLGLIIGIFEAWFKSKSKRPEIIAFYIWVALYFRRLVMTGLSMLFIPFNFVLILFIFLILSRWKGFYIYSSEKGFVN